MMNECVKYKTGAIVNKKLPESGHNTLSCRIYEWKARMTDWAETSVSWILDPINFTHHTVA